MVFPIWWISPPFHHFHGISFLSQEWMKFSFDFSWICSYSLCGWIWWLICTIMAMKTNYLGIAERYLYSSESFFPMKKDWSTWVLAYFCYTYELNSYILQCKKVMFSNQSQIIIDMPYKIIITQVDKRIMLASLWSNEIINAYTIHSANVFHNTI